MRVTNVILNVMSLALVVVGVALTSTFFLPLFSAEPTASSNEPLAPPEDFNVPVLTTPEKTTPEGQSTGETKGSEEASKKETGGNSKEKEEKKDKKSGEKAAPVPEDKTLWVTIPKMSRIEDAAFPSTAGDDEDSLKDYAGIHLEGTGFPWQDEANVYIAGHRLGYPSTDSFLAFWDLNEVEKGDEVYVKDAMGRSYTYRVFKESIVGPNDIFVTQTKKDRNIITLQTCTLPDYSERLIVQAEKVA